MSDANKSLGKLLSVYGIAPAYLQRTIFIVILSFLFFLAMMFVYYIRQAIGYFLLASAFLVLYLVTLFSWVIERRSHLEVFEDGFKYKNNSVMWNEIEDVSSSGEIKLGNRERLTIPTTISDFEGVVRLIRNKMDVIN